MIGSAEMANGRQKGEPMNDLISRQAAIDAVESAKTARTPDGEIYVAKLNAEMNIRILPSAQPEIIRCRDCIAYQEGIDIDGKPFTRCNGINGSVRTYGHTLPDWYCADAERRRR